MRFFVKPYERQRSCLTFASRLHGMMKSPTDHINCFGYAFSTGSQESILKATFPVSVSISPGYGLNVLRKLTLRATYTNDGCPIVTHPCSGQT